MEDWAEWDTPDDRPVFYLGRGSMSRKSRSKISAEKESSKESTMEYFIKAHPTVIRCLRNAEKEWTPSGSMVSDEELQAGVVGFIIFPVVEDQEMDPESIIINLKNRMVIEKF